eukprot:m.604576 g.604576  ORF g.604576 m.604576 type:complete len:340 (-) comp22460_c0_seq2:3045-4064(-)
MLIMYNQAAIFFAGVCVGMFATTIFVPPVAVGPSETHGDFSLLNVITDETNPRDRMLNLSVRHAKTSVMPQFASKYFIVVKSTPSAAIRRNTMRQTWLSDVSNHPDFIYRYFIDEGKDNLERGALKQECAENQDVVILDSTALAPSSGSTRQIGLKMIGAMKWALRNVRSRFLIIADDDTYVNSAVLFEDVKTWPTEKMYLGFHMKGQKVIHHETQPDPRYAEKDYPLDVFPKYASGIYFALSADLVSAFAFPPAALRSMTNDDSQVGTVLLAYDVQYVHRATIMPWGHQKKDTRCKPTSDIYAVHATPVYWPSISRWQEDMLQLHKNLTDKPCVVGFT